MLSRNAPLLYVQQQGGWRSASVLLRVYARVDAAGPGAVCRPGVTRGSTGRWGAREFRAV